MATNRQTDSVGETALRDEATTSVFAPRGAPLTFRMLLGPIVALAALLIVSVTFLGLQSWTESRTQEAFARFTEALEAERIFMRLSDGHALLMRAAALRGADHEMGESLRLAERGGADVAAALGEIERLSTFRDRHLDRLQGYRVAAGHLQTVLSVEEFSIALASADASSKFDALRRIIDQSSVAASERAAEARELAADARSQALTIALAVASAGVILALLVSVSVSRAVAKPLSRMVGRVVELARGDLDTVIPQTGKRDEVGALASALRVFRDTAQKLHQQAYHDTLTKLPNRAGFEMALAEREKHGAPFAAFLIDLDKFKDVNDTLGHDAGDLLLCQVADRFRAALPEDWMLARLGGDEFAVIAPGVGTPEAVIDDAWKLVHAAAETFNLSGQVVQIGASVGVACWPRHAQDRRGLLKHADLALYEAKDVSRNTVAVFREELTDEIERRRAIETQLRRQLEEGRIVAYYQPVVELATGKPAAIEATARLSGEDGRDVASSELLAVAEDSGLADALNVALLDQALDAMAHWPERLRLTLNISARPLRRAAFADRLLSALESRKISPNRVTIELNERAFWKSPAAIEQGMRRLREHGFRFAFDGFGVGFTCVKSLSDLPLSEVKIDRSLAHGLGVQTGGQGDAVGVMRTIVELARSLDLLVTAEGVENDEQRRLLDFIGAERGQGMLFSQPLNQEELGIWLRSTKGGPRRVA